MTREEAIGILKKNTKESYQFHIKNGRKLDKQESEWFEALQIILALAQQPEVEDKDIKIESLLDDFTLHAFGRKLVGEKRQYHYSQFKKGLESQEVEAGEIENIIKLHSVSQIFLEQHLAKETNRVFKDIKDLATALLTKYKITRRE